jgi:putative cell wall-binding protein
LNSSFFSFDQLFKTKIIQSLGVTIVERVAGKDRFDTSLLIAKKYFFDATEVANRMVWFLQMH